MDFSIDFGSNSGLQTRGKGAKKAAKKAQQAKWLDSDNEDGGKGADGGEGGDGDNGGGDGGGAGGDGGGDEGGGDDWDFGGGGKKSKKKSKKKQEEEEEEEQRKKEEEAAGKQEDGASKGNTLDWANDANDANGDDNWGGFSTGKKDKKKKGKKVGFEIHINFDDSNTFRVPKMWQLCPICPLRLFTKLVLMMALQNSTSVLIQLIQRRRPILAAVSAAGVRLGTFLALAQRRQPIKKKTK